MRLIRFNRESPEQPLQERRRPPSRLRAGALAIPLLLGTAPMLEGKAVADATPQSRPAASRPSPVNVLASLTMKSKGDRISISDGTNFYLAYGVNRKDGPHPSKEVVGPAKAYVRYFPAVKLSRFESVQSIIPWTVKYEVDGPDGKREGREHSENVAISNLRTPEIDHTKVAIGSEMRITVEVPKGTHRIVFPTTNGFVLLERIERLRGKETRKRPEPPPPRKALRKAVAEAAKPHEEDGEQGQPRFSLEAEREWLHSIGSSSAHGDLNVLDAAANIWLGRSLALSLGLRSSSFGLGIEDRNIGTTLRSYSAEASVGLLLLLGQHRVGASASGGYRVLLRDIGSDSGIYSDKETTHGYAAGGRASYGYGHMLDASVSVSNDPFCPLSGRFRFVLPLRYHMSTELDAMLLHAAKPLAEQGLIGGVSLSEKNVYARLIANFPLWKLWRVEPSLLLGGALNASESGSKHADIALGGGLSLSTGRLHLHARGGVFILGKAPLLQLGIGY